MCRSVPQIEAVLTRTSTSAGPTEGIATVSSERPAPALPTEFLRTTSHCVGQHGFAGEKILINGEDRAVISSGSDSVLLSVNFSGTHSRWHIWHEECCLAMGAAGNALFLRRAPRSSAGRFPGASCGYGRGEQFSSTVTPWKIR